MRGELVCPHVADHHRPPRRHARHRPQPARSGRCRRALRRRGGASPSRPPRIQGRSRALRRTHPLGDRAGPSPAGAERPADSRSRRWRHARRGLRCAAPRRALVGPLALPRPRRRRGPAASRAGREPLPWRRVRRELPARAAPQGAPDAAREPTHRRRRRPRQDRRGGVDSHRAAAPAPHPACPRPHPRVVAPAVAGRALGQVLPPVRGRGPPGNRAPAPPTRHGRESLALVQPHRRLLPLPAPTRRAGAVPARPAVPPRALRTCRGTC